MTIAPFNLDLKTHSKLRTGMHIQYQYKTSTLLYLPVYMVVYVRQTTPTPRYVAKLLRRIHESKTKDIFSDR